MPGHGPTRSRTSRRCCLGTAVDLELIRHLSVGAVGKLPRQTWAPFADTEDRVAEMLDTQPPWRRSVVVRNRTVLDFRQLSSTHFKSFD